ncbi:MAG: DNA repair protein RadC, partial [Pseudomonadota bacterium]
MTISHWPSGEKPREKLLKNGPETLSDAELLAIFINTGTRGRNAITLAREMLKQLGSIRNLLESDLKTLSQFKGIGKVKYVRLQAALEISRRHLAEGLERTDCLINSKMTKNYLQARLRGMQQEVFVCLMLDNRNRVIAIRELFRGTIDSASVYPREVVKQALSDNAAAVILAHNHPSGLSEPS